MDVDKTYDKTYKHTVKENVDKVYQKNFIHTVFNSVSENFASQGGIVRTTTGGPMDVIHNGKLKITNNGTEDYTVTGDRKITTNGTLHIKTDGSNKITAGDCRGITKTCWAVRRQFPVLMDSEHPFHEVTCDAIPIDRIHCLRHNRYCSKLANSIGGRK